MNSFAYNMYAGEQNANSPLRPRISSINQPLEMPFNNLMPVNNIQNENYNNQQENQQLRQQNYRENVYRVRRNFTLEVEEAINESIIINGGILLVSIIKVVVNLNITFSDSETVCNPYLNDWLQIMLFHDIFYSIMIVIIMHTIFRSSQGDFFRLNNSNQNSQRNSIELQQIIAQNNQILVPNQQNINENQSNIQNNNNTNTNNLENINISQTQNIQQNNQEQHINSIQNDLNENLLNNQEQNQIQENEQNQNQNQNFINYDNYSRQSINGYYVNERAFEMNRFASPSYNIARIVYIFLFIWGNILLYNLGVECGEKSPQHYYLAISFIIMGYFYLGVPIFIIGAACLCMPLLLLIYFIVQRRGQVINQWNPADTKFIEDLKVQNFSKEVLGNSIHNECCICLCEYQKEDKLIVLPCSKMHHFHEKCIIEWLKQNGVCPICKTNLNNINNKSQQQSQQNIQQNIQQLQNSQIII